MVYETFVDENIKELKLISFMHNFVLLPFFIFLQLRGLSQLLTCWSLALMLSGYVKITIKVINPCSSAGCACAG